MLTLRPRTDDDVPALVRLLTAQQPASRYPLRWPLPFPPEDFVVRPGQAAAWVAELDDLVVGHAAVASLTDAADPAVAGVFAAALPGRRCGTVSVLFVDQDRRGHGIGAALLAEAVAHVRAAGQAPVLDVVPLHGPAVAFYARRGWVQVGSARPAWLPAWAPDLLLMTLPD